MGQSKDTSGGLLGRIAVELRMITPEQLSDSIRYQGEQVKARLLGDVMVELGHLEVSQLKTLLDAQKEWLRSGKRLAVRQDPNVIFVGEPRDRETMALALSAAEMGFLVFGALHTSSAAKTIDRIVDLFPPLQQPGVRLTVAAVLRGVVAQLLLRSADGTGRLAVQEILVGSTAVSNILREGATAKLYSLIQAGAGQGMQTMDQALLAAVQSGRIQPEEAWKKARDKTRFEKLMEG